MEGTPTELKRKSGKDQIIVTASKQSSEVLKELTKLKNISKVDQVDGEIILSSAHGSAVIASVVLALEKLNVKIKQINFT